MLAKPQEKKLWIDESAALRRIGMSCKGGVVNVFQRIALFYSELNDFCNLEYLI
jgi:hypothetical protein